MKYPLTVLTLIGTMMLCHGSIDITSPWKSIIIELANNTKVKAVGQHALTALSIEIKDVEISVPESELSDINLPLLNTITVQYGHYYHHQKKEDNHPYTVIQLSYGKADSHNQLPYVQYIFSEEKLQRRCEYVPIEKNKWQEYIKLPSQEKSKGGMITKVRHDE